MTDFNRSSTLSLRRPGGPASGATRSKPAAPTQACTSAVTAPAGAPEVGTACAALDSTTLLQGRSVVGITHNGETYQLRATRLGKLILTK
ncbi:hemin uptake protein HemP [Paraburkholderia dinghuensis]|uniref:Hemin uptake protein HemP n=1 Tax=Paraburkholderia dinghuensis TaxID=2305225 RepID=A0A3N6MW17_9BURK|nr:hemin uptake protein HemP [Paraburkholderia dinghuensis]RQH00552.1 hemin uptake protein HemP [Paraburkholderia dinghuensis]